MQQDGFLRFNALRQITGLSRTTIWRLERVGEFPPRRSLTQGTVGWLKSEVEAWVAAKAPCASTGDRP